MESLSYINSVMKEINSMTDDIYESLVDCDYEELKKQTQNLIKVLRDLQKTHETVSE